MSNSEQPKRRHPAHPVPVERWNQPVVLMVTVVVRQPNPYHCFDHPGFQEALLRAWRAAPDWRPGYFMIMPDHIHLFCVPGGRESCTVAEWVRRWKAHVTRSCKEQDWRWLPGCWDTQMRGVDHYVEKRSYVGGNPVRKHLVGNAADWPYQGECHPIVW